tara:strand:+ start:794 stop:1210 length:417 start_codon:yes stop_codon:yes gene_type:complete
MGLIKHPKRLKQIVDYTGIEFGKIHPSDIDGVLEFDNKYLFLLEFKHQNVKPKNIKDFNNDGQNIMLKRIVDSWQSCKGKEGFVAYIFHDTPSSENILAENTVVSGYYHNGEYVSFNRGLKDFFWEIGNEYDIKKIIA